MNTAISAMKRAGTIKFIDNMSYKCTQLNVILEFLYVNLSDQQAKKTTIKRKLKTKIFIFVVYT